MGCERLAGFSGFYFNCWEIFENDHLNYLAHLDHDTKIFSATEKNPINPEYPVFTIRPAEIDASPGLAKKS
jgi:hypothetical protein